MRKCRFCHEQTNDVCMSCRLPTCEDCGYVSHKLWRLMNGGVDKVAQQHEQLPIICDNCYAKDKSHV